MSFSSLNVAVLAMCTAGLLAGCSAAEKEGQTAAPVASGPTQKKAADALRLDGVTVVDPVTGKLTPGMSILVENGRIVSIMPLGATSTTPAPGIHLVDASGKFIVPGYNDMHSHALTVANASGVLAVMLAEGVTGFRQMDGSPELLAARRNGTLPVGADAPALLAMPGSLVAPMDPKSVPHAVAEVQLQKQQGADFIKIVSATPDVFFATVAAANKVGLTAVGHLQEGVDPADASRAGFRSIEHLGPDDTMWIGCSTDKAALLADALAHPRLPMVPFKIPDFVAKMAAGKIRKALINPAASEKPADTTRLQRAFDTYSDANCHALAAVFVANQTWQVPTLVRLRTQYLADSPEYQQDPALAYIPPAALADWRDTTDKFSKMPQVMLATFREAYRRDLLLTKMFADAGVPMMAGTDGGGQVPGQSLLQEFDELSKAGLTPLKILQMTTVEPARFLGRSKTMGTVAVGKNADLVLLDANPLDSVGNMHQIAGVVRGGRYYSAGDLDALRAHVAAGKGVHR